MSERTIRNWCQSRKVEAIQKQGGGYLVSIESLQDWILRAKSQISQPVETGIYNHQDFLGPWKAAMASGLLTGKPFSRYTQAYYTFHVERYFAEQTHVTMAGLAKELTGIPVEQFATRDKFHKALVCFSKFLVSKRTLGAEVLSSIKTLKPKRHRPPKRKVLTAGQLETLQGACSTFMERAMVALLASTGLRAGELCALTVGDLDMEYGILTVQCGKGGKRRRVGLNIEVLEALRQHISPDASKATALFQTAAWKPIDRDGLFKRLRRISKAVGVDFQPDLTHIGTPQPQGILGLFDKWIAPLTQSRLSRLPIRLKKRLFRLDLHQLFYGKNAVFNYVDVAKRMLNRPQPSYRFFPGVLPGWNNTARRPTGNAIVLKRASPKNYAHWLRGAINQVSEYPPQERLVFINAWNEWAEGAVLEPTAKWGRQFLEATLAVAREDCGSHREETG